MGARTKLNVAYFNGALITALLIGLGFQSVWVFGLVLGVLVAGHVLTGNVRFKKRE